MRTSRNNLLVDLLGGLALLAATVTATTAHAAGPADDQGSVRDADLRFGSLVALAGPGLLGANPPAWRSGFGGMESSDANLRRPGGIAGVSLMGDYYFAHPFAAAGGFRATSGLMVGPRSQWLSIAQPNPAAGGSFSVDSSSSSRGRSLGAPALLRGRDAAGAETTAALPYIGLGYTGRAARGALSLNADIGMVGPSFGDGGGRPFGASLRSLDEPGRDSRLLPVLQLGVLYSF